MSILVVDVGGTNVKIKLHGNSELRKFPSGADLTPSTMVRGVLTLAEGWNFDRVSVGYPGPVIHGHIAKEPVNLGPGWLGMDFTAGFGRPTRVMNDAAMQALGSYQGGRMLFLGLGTGLGNCLVYDNVVAPMELGHLPYKKGKTFEDFVGNAGMKRLGRRKWQAMVFDVVQRLRDALLPEYVVLGGGNVKKLDELPPGCRQGDNENAFVGGVRLWERESV
ncbi:MAG: ROK family protein [Gemmataceae bacterium]